MKIVVYDTETTGLVQNLMLPIEQQPHIIEIAAVLVDERGDQYGSFHCILDPQIPVLDPKITQITGLTHEMLKGKPTFEAMLPAIRATFSQADAVLAHNLSFDLDMMRIECKRHRVSDFPMPLQRFCSMHQYKHIRGKWFKQGELYKHFMGKPQAAAHRAMDDVQALIECLKAANFFQEVANAKIPG